MAKRTVEQIMCDVCGKTLANGDDRVAVRGVVYSPANLHAPLTRDAGATSEGAWCWRCLRELADGSAAARSRELYRDAEPDSYRKPGGGASGPLPPPEIRAVGVAAALSGVRSR